MCNVIYILEYNRIYNCKLNMSLKWISANHKSILNIVIVHKFNFFLVFTKYSEKKGWNLFKI